ncbi:hypothetical protein D3C78_1108570 [compost metagenome]
MLEVEVTVAPGLVTRVDVGTKRRTGALGHLVPVQAIFFVAVVRGQIETAAEPPDRFFTFFLGDKEPHVGVRGRYMRVMRMDDQ